eukprot:3524690-Pyramimonas_sp.AAC.1
MAARWPSRAATTCDIAARAATHAGASAIGCSPPAPPSAIVGRTSREASARHGSIGTARTPTSSRGRSRP